MFKDFKPINFRSTSYFKAILTTILLYIIHILTMGTFVYFSGNTYISYMFANIFLIIIIFFLERKRLINEVKSFKEESKGKVINIIIVTIALLLLEFIANFIIIKIIGSTPDSTKNIIDLLKENNSTIIPFIINSALLLPIIEAIIYFYPYDNIKNNKVKWIVYTVIFALFHMISTSSAIELLYIIPYLLLSFSITY